MATDVEREPAKTNPVDTLIIDCDVHPHYRDGINDLSDYLPREWVRQIAAGPNRRWAKQPGVELALPHNGL